MRPDSRRPGDLTFSGTRPTGRAGSRPSGRAGSRPRGAPGPSVGGGGDDGGVVGGVIKALGCATIAFPVTLAGLSMGAALALSACQPKPHAVQAPATRSAVRP